MTNTQSGRGAVFAWSLYDFANSAFTTLVVTFIYASWFTHTLAPDVVTGTAMWSRGVTLTGIVVGLLSPILGAVADRHNCRRLLLGVTTLLCIVSTAALYLPTPGQMSAALALFVLASIGFELGTVFYNSFLPEIAPANRIGRVSGYGWAFGYVGGLLCMAIAMVGFVDNDTPWFGLTTEAGQNIRATNLLVAGWFALFSLPLFLRLREPPPHVPTVAATDVGPWRELWATLRRIRQFPQISRLLLARLFYNDGLITVFSFAGIYAMGTLGFTFRDLMFYGVSTNAAAGVGAFLGGYVDDRLGGRRTVLLSLAGMTLASIVAISTSDSRIFWGASLCISALAGPTQAASRSLLGRFVPRQMENEFYGFYAFSGKATAFAGPFLLGVLTEAFASQRAGVSVVVAFFIVGGILLTRVDEAAGMRQVARADR
jgi:MFS transporter, UMF1 family